MNYVSLIQLESSRIINKRNADIIILTTGHPSEMLKLYRADIALKNKLKNKTYLFNLFYLLLCRICYLFILCFLHFRYFSMCLRPIFFAVLISSFLEICYCWKIEYILLIAGKLYCRTCIKKQIKSFIVQNMYETAKKNCFKTFTFPCKTIYEKKSLTLGLFFTINTSLVFC